LVPQRACAQGLQRSLTVCVPDRAHQAAEFSLILSRKGPHRSCDMPEVQQPTGVGEVLFPQSFQAFVTITDQDMVIGDKQAMSQQLELTAQPSQWHCGNQQMLLGKAEAGRAACLVTAHSAGVMQAKVYREMFDLALAAALLGF
ncbi:MAG: hypothetical protein N3A66_08945, partial [Planctomycetota bacterium]|nr:hypothetical protein [Planctomycetota bacterium]